MSPRLVIDTNVVVAALVRARGGASRQVLRLCLARRCRPVMGDKLFHEYEAVMGREDLFRTCPLSRHKRDDIWAGLASVCEWVTIQYLWRPNLPDEADNHVVELAVAGSARAIVTHNVRDFRRAELRFPSVKVLTPAEFLREGHFHGDNDHPPAR